MDKDKKRAIIEKFLEAYNNFDIGHMMELVHPDILFRNISDGKVDASAAGAGEFRALAEQSKQLFSAREQLITKFEPTESGASVEIDYTGILAADLPNGMKAGDTVRLTGRSEFSFRDGKIFRLTDYS